MRLFLALPWNQAHEQTFKGPHERECHHAAHYGENGVRHGNRHHRAAIRNERLPHRHERGQHQRQENGGADHVQKRMREGSATCRGIAASRGDPRGHGGADVRAEQRCDCGLVRNKSLSCENHRKGDGGSGVDRHGDNGRAERNQCDAASRGDARRVKHPLREFAALERLNSLCDEAQPKKEKPEPQHGKTEVAQRLAPHEEIESAAYRKAGKPRQGGRRGVRDDPHSPRRSDVRADYHVDGLSERHHSRTHRSHEHRRDDGGGLDYQSRYHARADARHMSPSGKRHELPQPPSSDCL